MAPPKSAVAQKLMQEDPTLLPSEDEDDSDFHLSDHGGNNSDSSDSDSDSGGAKRKRKRSPPPTTAANAEPAIDKATVDDLWAQFNNPLDDPYAHQPAKTTSKPEQDHPELVTIEVEYEFAGEKLKQKKQVARTSAEAQAYFARNPPPSNAASSSSSSSSATAATTTSAPLPPPAPAPSKPTDPTTASLDALFGPDPEQPSTPSTSTSAGSFNPPKQEAGPPPPAPLAPAAKRRKTGKGGGLAGMAAAMGVGGKPAKLNTLEKSKLDWTSYVSSETGLEDSLAHARKDGYLDRRDFLDRVEGHKSEQFDQARQASRRGAAGKR